MEDNSKKVEEITYDHLLLPLETVFVPEYESKVLDPISSSSSEMNFLNQNLAVTSVYGDRLNSSNKLISNDGTKNYCYKKLVSSSSYSGSEIRNEDTNSKLSKNHISLFKKKIRYSIQKKKELEKSLQIIDEVLKNKVNVTRIDNLPFKNLLIDTVDNMPVSKTNEHTQISCDMIESKIKGLHVKEVPNQQKDEECNIDGLKGCIIEASKALIKAEKSFRILSKLIHHDVLVEKRTASKHVKDFQYTMSTLQKRIIRIDQNLNTRYPRTTPHLAGDLLENTHLSEENHSTDKEIESSIREFEIISGATFREGKRKSSHRFELQYQQ